MIESDFCRYFTLIQVCKPILPEFHCRRFCYQVKPGKHDGAFFWKRKSIIDKKPNFALQCIRTISRNAKCRFHIIFENRFQPFQQISEPPVYVIVVAHTNGEKIRTKDTLKRNCFEEYLCMTLYSFHIDIYSNDDIVNIMIVRFEKRNIIQDFYVTIYSKYDFNLYNVDNPSVLIPETNNKGIYFENYSELHPNVAFPLMTGVVNGKKVLVFDKKSKNVKDPLRKEKIENLRAELDAETTELSINEMYASDKTDLIVSHREKTNKNNHNKYNKEIKKIDDNLKNISFRFTKEKVINKKIPKNISSQKEKISVNKVVNQTKNIKIDLHSFISIEKNKFAEEEEDNVDDYDYDSHEDSEIIEEYLKYHQKNQRMIFVNYFINSTEESYSDDETDSKEIKNLQSKEKIKVIEFNGKKNCNEDQFNNKDESRAILKKIKNNEDAFLTSLLSKMIVQRENFNSHDENGKNDDINSKPESEQILLQMMKDKIKYDEFDLELDDILYSLDENEYDF